MSIKLVLEFADSSDAQLMIALYEAMVGDIRDSNLSLDELPAALRYLSNRIAAGNTDYHNLDWDKHDWEFMGTFAGLKTNRVP